MVALTGKGSHISSLALNPTRNLIAFTEFGDRPLLVVYDLENRKKLKLLRCAEFKSHDVVSLAFSHDSKYILVQGGHPDYQVVYFFWEKGKVITSITRYRNECLFFKNILHTSELSASPQEAPWAPSASIQRPLNNMITNIFTFHIPRTVTLSVLWVRMCSRCAN